MRMAAFCDVVPEKAEKLRAEFGGDYATTSVDKVMEDPRITAVYVCNGARLPCGALH